MNSNNDDIQLLKQTFNRNLRQLESIVNNFDTDSVVTSSGILRLLLFDWSNGGKPIVDRLMENKNVKLFYEINADAVNDRSLNQKIESTYVIWREVNVFEGRGSVKLSKAEFLNYECLYFRGNEYTVKDVIEFYGYVLGGIHLDEKLSVPRKKLLEAFKAVKIQQASQLDHTMRGIIQVVYTCLIKNKEVILH